MPPRTRNSRPHFQTKFTTIIRLLTPSGRDRPPPVTGTLITSLTKAMHQPIEIDEADYATSYLVNVESAFPGELGVELVASMSPSEPAEDASSPRIHRRPRSHWELAPRAVIRGCTGFASILGLFEFSIRYRCRSAAGSRRACPGRRSFLFSVRLEFLRPPLFYALSYLFLFRGVTIVMNWGTYEFL